MDRRHLPTTWVFARTPSGCAYTFRWGRGAGFLTVHVGDQRASHDDDSLLEIVHIGRDWDDDDDVRVVARQWLIRNDAARHG